MDSTCRVSSKKVENCLNEDERWSNQRPSKAELVNELLSDHPKVCTPFYSVEKRGGNDCMGSDCK